MSEYPKMFTVIEQVVFSNADKTHTKNATLKVAFNPSDEEKVRTFQKRWSDKLKISLDKAERDRLQIVIDTAVEGE